MTFFLYIKDIILIFVVTKNDRDMLPKTRQELYNDFFVVATRNSIRMRGITKEHCISILKHYSSVHKLINYSAMNGLDKRELYFNYLRKKILEDLSLIY